jgi:hypothetical protein
MDTHRAPLCSVTCGSRSYQVDTYRMKAEWHIRPCECGSYHFPHFRGRGRCIYSPMPVGITNGQVPF